MTQMLLFTCNYCVRLNADSEVLLIEDIKEHVQTVSERSCAYLMSSNRGINSVQTLFDQASGVCL